MQKQYWDTWGNMTKASSAQPQAGINMPPWGQTMTDWWSSSASAAPNNDVSDVMSRVSSMGKMYMSMAEMMYKAQNQTSQYSDASKDPMTLWMSLMEGGFGDWAKQISQGNTPEHGIGIGTMHFEGWQKVLKSMGMDTLPDMGSFNLNNTQGWQDQLRKMLSTPGIGYSRESQEQLNGLGILMLDYQDVQNEYLTVFSKQGMDSMQALREKIASLSAEGKEIKTLRELFDLWINVNEEEYGKFAMSDEYQVVYGDMVNAFMKLKAGINDQVEVVYKAANLPTRSDFNASLKKQQELKRENRRLHKSMRDVLARLNALETGGTPAAGNSSAQPSESSVPEAKAKKKATPKKEKKAKEKAKQTKTAAEDDLTKIKGLGGKMSGKLYDMGIKNLMELSEYPLDQLDELDKALGSQSRLLRDDWVGQAKSFLDKTKS